jgi:hypothetical protein
LEGSKYGKIGVVKEKIVTCSYCGNEAIWISIIDGDGHKQIERFCDACSKIYGPSNLKLKVVS